MSYQQDIENCFANSIGPNGLTRDEFDAILSECEPVLARLRDSYADGSMPLLCVPGSSVDIDTMEGIASRYLESFDDVAVLGVGGSSIGAKALAALARTPHAVEDDCPRLHFIDNIDPHEFDRLLHGWNPARIGFLVISKSGRTAETISQFLHCAGALRDARPAEKLADQFTIITDPGERPLRTLGIRLGLPILDHEPGIGGRFSAFTNVGLLPALIAGVDAATIRQGASDVIKAMLDSTTSRTFPPAEGAAINIGLARHRGIGATVLMPYIDRLAEFGLWFRQLWAESLGKQGVGTTPIRSLGTVDQHSQLQLYLDGPPDKMFTLLFNAVSGIGGEIPSDLADLPELNYLAGRRIGDLMDAEQRATAETLARHGRPTRILRIEHLDEHTIGALMMHFMLETIIAANLLGVNPFNQPAVDEGKRLARQYLSGKTPS